MLAARTSWSQSQVKALPSGKYETFFVSNEAKWERGDIILIDDGHYRLSSNQAEVGEYKFSSTAQRIFFTSGPLQHFFAKTSLVNEKPVIILPSRENAQQGTSLSADIRGTYRN